MNNKLKVVLVSNFMNHHQLPVALEMAKIYDYTFIATEPIAQEQLNMKYEDMNKKYDFILRSYEEDNYNKAIALINEADVVIFGSCPFEMIEHRIKNNKLTFRYSERLFKDKALIRKFHPAMWKKYFSQCTKYKDKNYYLLCASAYAAKDYAWFGAFKNKAYKWGYFPEVEQKDVDNLIEQKNLNKKLQIVWCNRLVKYKHPELAVMGGKFLKEKGYDFEIKVIGVGPLKEMAEMLIKKFGLEKYVLLMGSMPTQQVRENLESANIALLTADKGEGWGAVVNESMNSCCAVLCNKFTGSVPYLVEDEKSGLMYKNNKEFFSKLDTLAKDSVLRDELGRNAYRSLTRNWNPTKAVENLDFLIDGLIKDKSIGIKDGPCSKA